MEISERELRGLVADVDDQHHAAMRTFTQDNMDIIRETGSSRRSFLATGATGAAIAAGFTLLPFKRLMGTAFAQTNDTTGDGQTSSTPPDAGIAAFAASVEFAAVAAYKAGAPLLTTPAVKTAATTFAMQHQQHGDAFAAASGQSGITANQALVTYLTPTLKGLKTQTDVLKFAYGLENDAAATYFFALGVLETTAAVDAVASVLPVESQHAMVLGHVLGMSPLDTAYMPAFQTMTGALSPKTFPK